MIEIKNNYTVPKTYTNSIGIKFVLIPPGTFLMGTDAEFSDEGPRHPVTITKPFFIGKYLVTQEQWAKIMGYNPSYFNGDNLPVESISWYETQEFIQKLNQKENTKKYRLPTEAEWEHSCRAFTKTRWFFGDNRELLDLYAWHKLNSNHQTHPVGLKRPNPFGLYDIYGNVWEWCSDRYSSKTYSRTHAVDPTGPNGDNNLRIARGNSAYSYKHQIYSARRKVLAANNQIANLIGFRIVKNI